MAPTALDQEAVARAENTFPTNTPIFMLNLIKLRPQAKYPDARFKDLSPASGYEVYMGRYVDAFRKAAAPFATDAEVTFIGGQAIGLVVAPGEEWDLVVLVKYSSIRTFRDIVTSKAYREDASPHRLAAITDARLIATVGLKTFADTS